MKILKSAAIIVFALLFTYSISCYMWCNYTKEGKQQLRERTNGPAASHVSYQ